MSATADDTRYNDGEFDRLDSEDEPVQNIARARYNIDTPPWLEEAEFFDLESADGELDSSVEGLVATIDTSNLSPGRHTIFIESQDANGNFGVPSAVFVDVLDFPEDAEIIDGTNKGDTLVGTQKSEVIYGRRGEDTVTGGLGDDLLFGNGGADVLHGDKQSLAWLRYALRCFLLKKVATTGSMVAMVMILSMAKTETILSTAKTGTIACEG